MAEETAEMLNLCLAQVLSECSSAAEQLAESQKRVNAGIEELQGRLRSIQTLSSALDTSAIPKAASDLISHQDRLKKLKARVDAVRQRITALETCIKDRP